MNKFVKTGVAVIFIIDNKILLGHRINDDTWGLVGGKIEWMESFEECAIRESIEEVNLTPIELEYIGINNAVDKSTNKQHITSFYHAIDYHGIYNNNEPNKHYEWKYFDIDNLPDNLFFPFKNYLPKLMEYINGIIRKNS